MLMRLRYAKFMLPLKYKLLSFNFFIFAGFLLLSAAILFLLIVPSLKKLEDNSAQKDMRRVITSILHEINTVDALAFDRGTWDDTYNFVLDRNTEYVSSNLADQTHIELKLNLIMIVDARGQSIWQRAFDLKTNRPIAITKFLKKSPLPSLSLVNRYSPTSPITGIINTDQGPMMVSSRPILKTNNTGQPRGRLILGRLLTSDLIQKIASRVGVPFTLIPLTRSESRFTTSKSNSIYLSKSGDERLKVNALLFDIIGKPLIKLSATVSEEISNQGTRAIKNVLLLMTLTGSTLLAIMLTATQRAVIAPLTKLAKHITNLGETGDLITKLNLDQQGEFGTIAAEMNRMQDNSMKRLSEFIHLGNLIRRHTKTLKFNEQHFDDVREPISDWILKTGPDLKFCNLPKQGEEFQNQEDTLPGAPIKETLFLDRARVDSTVKTQDFDSLESRQRPKDFKCQFTGRKGRRVDAALRQSQHPELHHQGELLRTVFEHMSQGIAVFDHKLNLVAANDLIFKQLGYSEDLREPGTPFEEFVHFNAKHDEYVDAHIEELVTNFVKRVQKKLPRQFEHTLPNGTVFEVINQPLPEGGFIATYADITEKKKAEKAQQFSEQRFKDVTSMTTDWIWEMGPDLRFTYVTQAGVKNPNQQKAILGKTRRDLLPAKELTGNAQKWAQHFDDLKNRRPFQDLVYKTKFGSENKRILRISGKPLFDEKGSFTGYRGAGRDITNKINAERALRQSEKQLTGVVSVTSDWIWELDKKLNWKYISSQFDNLAFLPRERLYGMSFVESVQKYGHFSNQAADAISRLKDNFADCKEFRGVEICFLDKAAKEIVLKVSGMPLFDIDGTFLGYVGACEDITETTRAQSKIIKQRNELMLANEQKDRLFTILSHDIQGPLSGVKGSLGMIKNHCHELSKKQIGKFSSLAFEGALQTQQLLDNLLEWSKLIIGRTETEIKTFNLVDIVDKNILFWEQMALNKKIDLITEVDDDLFAKADPMMIDTVLRNLIHNALKFTNAGGEILISPMSQDEVGFKITDTGCGMDNKQLKRFVNHQVLKSTTGNEGEEGSGIGLRICTEFIEKNGGTITIESKFNKGTMITVLLPKGDCLKRRGGSVEAQ